MAGPFTLTAQCAGQEPKGHNVGMLAVCSTLSLDALPAPRVMGELQASATGLTVVVAKVPSRARLLNIYADYQAGAGNDIGIKLGFAGSLSELAASSTAGAGLTGSLLTAMPYEVSLTDGAVPQHREIVATLSVTSLTALGFVRWTTWFTNDPIDR